MLNILSKLIIIIIIIFFVIIITIQLNHCTFALFVQKSSKIEVLVLLILQRVNFVYISHASLCNQLRELYFSCVDFPPHLSLMIYDSRRSTKWGHCFVMSLQALVMDMSCSMWGDKIAYWTILFIITIWLFVWTPTNSLWAIRPDPDK
jgi:hypothetical protein